MTLEQEELKLAQDIARIYRERGIELTPKQAIRKAIQ